MKRLAKSATTHLLHHGNTSDLFLTYFGAGADPAVPIGYFERILEGDKTGTLFRVSFGACGGGKEVTSRRTRPVSAGFETML